MNRALTPTSTNTPPPASGWFGSRSLRRFGQIAVIRALAQSKNCAAGGIKPIKCEILRARAIHSRALRMRSDIYFATSKAGDPVFRGVSDGIEKPRRIGYPACGV